MILSLLHRWLIPEAEAVVLNQAGQQNPGVQSMWRTICQTLPFCNVGFNAPGLFVAKLIAFIFSIFGGVAVLVIIYAGIKMLLSQGNDEALTDARKIILYAAVGIILALLANGIVYYLSTVVLNQALR